MVVHEETQLSYAETIKKATKKCIPVKNHVREIPLQEQMEHEAIKPEKNVSITPKKRKLANSKANQESSNSDCESEAKATEINKSDLEELRTVYKKCKAIVKKIESKYGHLLELEHDGCTNYKKCREYDQDESLNYGKCTCKVNTKIVFDESGNEVIREPLDACPHKPPGFANDKTLQSQENVQVYTDEVLSLPDDMKELRNILKNTEMDVNHRDQVINKMRWLKQEYAVEIKCDRQCLIEELKLNPDEMLEFKGTNLSSLVGYTLYK